MNLWHHGHHDVTTIFRRFFDKNKNITKWAAQIKTPIMIFIYIILLLDPIQVSTTLRQRKWCTYYSHHRSKIQHHTKDSENHLTHAECSVPTTKDATAEVHKCLLRSTSVYGYGNKQVLILGWTHKQKLSRLYFLLQWVLNMLIYSILILYIR